MRVLQRFPVRDLLEISWRSLTRHGMGRDSHLWHPGVTLQELLHKTRGETPHAGLRAPSDSECVKRAPNTPTSCLVQHVSIDHGRPDLPVAKQLLDGPNVVPVLEQVCRK